MAITRSTLIDDLDGLSIYAHRRLLVQTDCQTVGELLDLGPDLHRLVGRRALLELAAELPARWRVRVLKPWPKPAARQQVQRVRVHCTGCGHVSSVVAHREAEPCSRCGRKVERRTKGRPRKQPDAV